MARRALCLRRRAPPHTKRRPRPAGLRVGDTADGRQATAPARADRPGASRRRRCRASPAPVTIAALLLAAGESTRMGRLKQLLPWDGEPLVAWQARQLRDGGANDVVVVLGHAATEL